MHIVIKIVGGLIGLAVIVWLGTRIKPPRFKSPNWRSRDLGSTHLPADLPVPVARYARAVFGDTVPLVESAVLIGRAELTFNGITFKGRFKFYHRAGLAYYHSIELTWFGLPVIKVHERYMDGQAILNIPGARIENDEKTNLSANPGLWAESIWLPSIWFTDDRVQWIAVDDTTAKLIVPDAADEEQFTLTFDPGTGLLKEMKTLRYQESDDPARHRWTNTAIEWGEKNGIRIPVLASTRWDDDKPWAVWFIDDVVYNVDVSGRFATFGGEYED
jgi:hypothetical protein